MKEERIDVLLKPVNKFIQHGTTGGVLLFGAALIAMIWANSPFADAYFDLWHVPFTIAFGDFVISKDLHHWINDGLMAVFFFVIGLELKRELIGGELSSFRKALLPLIAGAGGMLIPAVIYVVINQGSPSVHGWGVPMATDIAFVLGILALLGNRVPLALKVFLTALAIADDLGAVIVIALFYTSNISLVNVAIGAVILGAMIGANLLGVRKPVFYAILGIGGLWLAFLLSGVHATIAGVLAAFAIPARTKVDENRFSEKMESLAREFRAAPTNDNMLVTPEQLHLIEEMKKCSSAAATPLQRLEHRMHPLVAFIVMPVFALANAGVPLGKDILSDLLSPVTVGIFLGLVVGKFVGIVGFTKIAVAMKWSELPEDTSWRHIYGVAFLAGIGFTMSLFITELAFRNSEFAMQAKLGILTASLFAGVFGFLLLRSAKTPETG